MVETGICSYPMFYLAYRTSPQESTGESHFFLMYGRDTVIPTTDMLIPHLDGRMKVDIDDYKLEIIAHMSSAWQAARDHIRVAQSKQKQNYDKHKRATHPHVSGGDHVMLYVPAERSGKAYKFARPFRGPYRVIRVLPNEVQLVLISKPKVRSIRVSLDRVRQVEAPQMYLKKSQQISKKSSSRHSVEVED